MTDNDSKASIGAAELLPCPFCGGDDVWTLAPTCRPDTPYNPADRLFPVARCRGCYAEVRGASEDYSLNNASAVKAWNTRLASTPTQEAVETVIDALMVTIRAIAADEVRNAEALPSHRLDPDEQADKLRAAIAALSPSPQPEITEQIRLAYKTGHTEGYTDATDDGTGTTSYADRDAAEEGWQQYAEKNGLDADPQPDHEGRGDVELFTLDQIEQAYEAWSAGDVPQSFPDMMRESGWFMAGKQSRASLSHPPTSIAQPDERAAILNDIAVMMSEFVDNWPNPKRVETALALIAKAMRAALISTKTRSEA